MAIVYKWTLNNSKKAYIINPAKITIKNNKAISVKDTPKESLEPLITQKALDPEQEIKITKWIDTLDLNNGVPGVDNLTDVEKYKYCFSQIVDNQIVRDEGNVFLQVEDYLYVNDSCDSLAGADGAYIEKIEYVGNELIQDSGFLPYKATLTNGKEVFFDMPRGPKGETGASGARKARAERKVYTYLDQDYIPNRPEDNSGKFDWTTDEIIEGPLLSIVGNIQPANVNTERWSLNVPEKVIKKNLWATIGIFGKDEKGNTISRWSMPYTVNGANGEPGKDGDSIEFIFHAGDSLDNKPTLITDGDKNVNIENGWVDNAIGVTRDCRIVWMAQRIKINNEWQEWNGPHVWSRWGEDGQDGDGIEYIFRLTKRDGFPLEEGDCIDVNSIKKYAFSKEQYETWEKEGKYQQDGFIPEAGRDGIETLWTDNPVRALNNDYVCEWVCIRKKKKDETGKLVWGKFSYPSVWSEKGDTGATGDMGPSGLSGIGYSMRYHLGDAEGPKNIDTNGALIPISDYNRKDVNLGAESILEEDIKNNDGWFKNFNALLQYKKDKAAEYPELSVFWLIQARTYFEYDKVTKKKVEKFEDTEQWSEPIIFTGRPGEAGKKAPILYPCGYYSPDKPYMATDKKAPYVYNAKDGNFYIFDREYHKPADIWYGGKKGDDINLTYNVVIDGEEYSVPTRCGGDIFGEEGKNFWTKMESFEAVYAKVGIIANGLIGDAVFNNEFMFSQEGTDPKGNPSTHYELFNNGYKYDPETKSYHRTTPDGQDEVLSRIGFANIDKSEENKTVFINEVDKFSYSACKEIAESSAPYKFFNPEFINKIKTSKAPANIIIALKCEEFQPFDINEGDKKGIFRLQKTGKKANILVRSEDKSQPDNFSTVTKLCYVYEDLNSEPRNDYYCEKEITADNTSFTIYENIPEQKYYSPKSNLTASLVENYISADTQYSGQYILNYYTYNSKDDSLCPRRENAKSESWLCSSLNNLTKRVIINDSPDPYSQNNTGLEETGFKPKFCLNFKKGEAWFAGGTIHMGSDGHTSITGMLTMAGEGKKVEAFLNGSENINSVPKKNRYDEDPISQKIIFATGVDASLDDKGEILPTQRQWFKWKLSKESGINNSNDLNAIKDAGVLLENEIFVETNYHSWSTSITNGSGNIYLNLHNKEISDAFRYSKNELYPLSNVLLAGKNDADPSPIFFKKFKIKRIINTIGGRYNVYYDFVEEATLDIHPLSLAQTKIFNNGTIETSSLYATGDSYFQGNIDAEGKFQGEIDAKGKINAEGNFQGNIDAQGTFSGVGHLSEGSSIEQADIKNLTFKNEYGIETFKVYDREPESETKYVDIYFPVSVFEFYDENTPSFWHTGPIEYTKIISEFILKAKDTIKSIPVLLITINSYQINGEWLKQHIKYRIRIKKRNTNAADDVIWSLASKETGQDGYCDLNNNKPNENEATIIDGIQLSSENNLFMIAFKDIESLTITEPGTYYLEFSLQCELAKPKGKKRSYRFNIKPLSDDYTGQIKVERASNFSKKSSYMSPEGIFLNTFKNIPTPDGGDSCGGVTTQINTIGQNTILLKDGFNNRKDKDWNYRHEIRQGFECLEIKSEKYKLDGVRETIEEKTIAFITQKPGSIKFQVGKVYLEITSDGIKTNEPIQIISDSLIT